MVSRILLAMAMTLGFGFWCGYAWHDDRAAIIKQQSQAIKQAGANIAQSAQQSQQVEASIHKSDSDIDQLNKAAQARLQKGKTHEPSIRTSGDAGNARGADNVAQAPAKPALAEVPDGAVDCGGDRLDLGTVRLLNRARD